MNDETYFSRRLALGRLGAIALAAFAIPTMVVASKAFAEDGEGGGSDGGHDGSGGADHDSKTETETDNETETETENETDDESTAVVPPAAAKVPAGDAVKKKKSKKK